MALFPFMSCLLGRVAQPSANSLFTSSLTFNFSFCFCYLMIFFLSRVPLPDYLAYFTLSFYFFFSYYFQRYSFLFSFFFLKLMASSSFLRYLESIWVLLMTLMRSSGRNFSGFYLTKLAIELIILAFAERVAVFLSARKLLRAFLVYSK